MRKILFVFLIGILTLPLFAQKKLTPRPPLFGIPAKTLPQGHWVFRGYWINNSYTQKWAATSGTMETMPANISYSTNVVWGKIRYGLTNKLTLILNVPYVNKEMAVNGMEKTGSGLGDVISAALYKLYHNKKQKFLVSALAFTKYATGKYKDLNNTELPLGTGSFDYGFSLLPEKEFGKWDMRWSAFYLFRGKNNSRNIDLGDALNLSWSTAFNFSPSLIFEGTLNYKKTFENKINGKSITDSDTYLFQIIPGVQYRIARTFLVQLVVPVNVSQKRTYGNTYETWFGLYYMM
jgi:hypothetical protein